MAALLNRAKMTTATTGTGTVTLGSAVTAFLTFAEAGAVNATVYSYVIEDGNDVEFGIGTYTSSGTTFSRDTVTGSKIGGTAGTSKINLSGSAIIAITALAEDIVRPPSSAVTVGHLALFAATNGLLLSSSGFAPREVLTANRTYYVRTDGSNSYTGLVDSAGGAFLTIQKALDVCATIDFNGFTVTVQVGDGTYTGAIIVPVTVGQAGVGNFILQGNSGTPANVLISVTSADAINCPNGSRITIKDFEIRTTTSGFAINCGGTLAWNNIRFGACAWSQILAQGGGFAYNTGNYAITGGAQRHWHASHGGNVQVSNATVTISGTPAFSDEFALATQGIIRAFTNTYSGSATGKRYEADMNGSIQTFGAGATALPGNVAGTVARGGQYA